MRSMLFIFAPIKVCMLSIDVARARQGLNRPRPRDQAEFSLLTLKGCSEQTRTRSRLYTVRLAETTQQLSGSDATGRGTSGIMREGECMTIKLAAETPRLPRINMTRWLISAAVATAIWGTAAPQRAVAQDQAASATDQSAPLAEVTVTGSRIARSRDMTAPSPITTVSSDAFQNTGATGAESILNKMPQF